MRSAPLAGVLGLLLAGAAVSSPVHADVVILADGSHLTGEVQGTELPVVTQDGPLTVGLRELREVTLAGAVGDVVRDKTGRVMTGLVDQPSYAIRLPSGQTIAFPRALVLTIRFSAK